MTVESVAAVRDRLLATKQRASVRAVIRELGGGSPNDVSAILRELDSKTPSVKTVTEQISRAYADIAERAATFEENYATMADACVAHERRIRELEALLADARAEVEVKKGELSARGDELVKAREDAAVREQEMHRRLASSQQQMSAVEHKLAAAETQTREAAGRVDEIRSRNDTLQREIATVRSQLQVAESDRHAAELGQAKAEEKASAEARRADEAMARETMLQEGIKVARNELAMSQQALAKGHTDMLALTASEAAAKQQAIHLLALLERLQSTDGYGSSHAKTTKS